MTQCTRNHPPNVICQARDCYLGEKNLVLRLNRLLDRTRRELRSVRQTVERREELVA